MRAIPIILIVAACGDNLGGPGDDAGVTNLIDTLHARTVGTIAPDNVHGVAIAALDDHRLAVARTETVGDAFCPDCVGLDPTECPSICTRSLVSIAVHDTTTTVTDPSLAVATVFPLSFDHDVSMVDVVALDAGHVGVGWLECDNSSCMGLFQKQSCTARYTTVELASGTVGTVQTLYTGWFGDLQLAFDPMTQHLLALVGKHDAFGVGLRRAMFDKTGATTISAWAPLGSFATRAAAVIASGGRFLVVADDRSPSQPAPQPPCAVSCDCLAAGGVELDTGGLFAFGVGDGPDTTELVAIGRGDDGFYGTREQITVIDAGDRTMIADSQSIDRSAEIFTDDGPGWTRRVRSKAPIPMWVGALGTHDHVAWLGSEVEPGQSATVQRLVAGVVAGDASERGTFTEPVDRNVFETAPVVTSAGVTTTFLLQGIFKHVGDTIVWDRFELLAVDADWP